jgi:hypothetical protein
MKNKRTFRNILKNWHLSNLIFFKQISNLADGCRHYPTATIVPTDGDSAFHDEGLGLKIPGCKLATYHSN